MLERCSKGTEHTQEATSWASVVDLYSSCVMFNDARAFHSPG